MSTFQQRKLQLINDYQAEIQYFTEMRLSGTQLVDPSVSGINDTNIDVVIEHWKKRLNSLLNEEHDLSSFEY